MAAEPDFEIETTSATDAGEALLVGTATLGVAGLTAADYLVSHAGAEQVGHVRTTNVPDVTPFTDGVPRRPVRLYALGEAPVSVLVSELSLPAWAADPLADAVVDWCSGAGVEEVAALHGGPFPHEEAEHVVFSVATEAFRERRLDDGEVPPLPGGFFDGLIGELVTRGLDDDAPAVGSFVTPVHPPGPDLEAAIRLLEAVRSAYEVTVDESELRQRAAEMRRYYEELAERMQALRGAEGAIPGQDYPEDRMFM